MSIIAWVVLGLFAGFIANKIVNHSGAGVVVDVILGVVGAVVGGFLFHLFGATGINGFDVWSLMVAVVGAIAVLATKHALMGRGLQARRSR